MVEYIGFYAYHRSYLVCPPVIDASPSLDCPLLTTAPAACTLLVLLLLLLCYAQACYEYTTTGTAVLMALFEWNIRLKFVVLRTPYGCVVVLSERIFTVISVFKYMRIFYHRLLPRAT